MPSTYELLIDSGAFSVWTQGRTIAIADYIAFLKECDQSLAHYINLDVLPGRYGEKRKASDVQEAAKASYRNLQLMKDADLHPLPVFHRGEDWKWLNQLLKDGEPYICLSPLTDSSTPVKRAWLDICFQRLKGSKAKIHGLGVTSLELMKRYPWYSVDSTSWAISSGNGVFPIPQTDARGQYDYLKPPTLIHIGGKDQATLKSFEGLGPFMQDKIQQFCEQVYGTTLSDLRYNVQARRVVVAKFWLKIAEALKLRIHFVVGNDMLGLPAALRDAGAKHWLLSYAVVTRGQRLKPYSESFKLCARTGYLIPPENVRPISESWNNPAYTNRRRIRLEKRIKAADLESPPW